jgi:tetratricopeptide (TPR) repeat protein
VEHNDTLIALSNIANLLQKKKNYDEAKALYERAYEVKVRLLGEEHEETQAIKEKIETISRRVARSAGESKGGDCNIM